MKHPPLHTVLSANAVFSIVSGAVLVVGWNTIAEWLGIPTWLSVAVGLGTVGFGVSVYLIARNPTPSATKQVIAADVAWVVVAGTIIVGFPDAMSTRGLWALGIVSLVVADLALFQILALRGTAVGASGDAVV